MADIPPIEAPDALRVAAMPVLCGAVDGPLASQIVCAAMRAPLPGADLGGESVAALVLLAAAARAGIVASHLVPGGGLPLHGLTLAA